MKLLNITVRNIVGLVVIIALAATMFWLIRERFQSQLTAQANIPTPSATHTPLLTATPSPTVTTPVLATFTPSLTPPPLVNFDTPAPGPTYTPTPEEIKITEMFPVSLVDSQRLVLEEINKIYPASLQADEYSTLVVVGWTEHNEVVVQRNYYIYQDNISHLLRVDENYWAISPNDKTIRILTGWRSEPTLTLAQEQLIESEDIRQARPLGEIPSRVYPSPDGQYVIKAEPRNKLYVYQVDNDAPIVTLPTSDNGKERIFNITGPVWSPDGVRIAYEVASDTLNDKWTTIYQIHISNVDGSNLVVIEPPYSHGYIPAMTWSPDGHYLAFIAQTGDHIPPDVFVAATNGSALYNITQDEKYATYPLFWSPDGHSIVYVRDDPNQPELSGTWILTVDIEE